MLLRFGLLFMVPVSHAKNSVPPIHLPSWKHMELDVPLVMASDSSVPSVAIVLVAKHEPTKKQYGHGLITDNEDKFKVKTNEQELIPF